MSTAYECPLGLSSETLSAWRDDLLPLDEQQRLSAHVRACDACRERLAGFEGLAQPLRAERAPEPDERLWRAIRAGMASAPQRGGFGGLRRGSHASGWRQWGALAAIAAVVLVVLGFAALFGEFLPGHGPTTHPTPTIAPRVSPTTTRTTSTGALDWQTATGWPGAGTLAGFEPNPPQISPSDGNTAYACVGDGTRQDHLRVWATHNFAAPNHGATWTRLADLPIAQQDVNGCAVVVDTTDPATLVAMAPSSAQEFGEVSFASFDGGQTWRQLSQQPRLFTGPIATYQDKIYGIVAMSYPQEYVNPNPYALRVSSDQMGTWQTLNSGDQFDAFWLNPSNGELLAHQFKSGQFVTSDDGGQTWRAFVNPSPFDTLSNMDVIAIQAPKAGQPWMVCGLTQTSGASSSQPATHAAVCTRDLGQTYTTLPNLPDTPAGTRDPAGAMRLIGITGDGTVLAMLSIDMVPQGPKGSGAVTGLGFKLWRLPPGAIQWQSLGVPPQFNLSYAPGALFAWPVAGVYMASCANCDSDYVAASP